MASSSISRSWRYDVFPSFRGEDVRRSFLSHLLEKLERKLVTTFIDHGIERSRPIGPELICAIRESRISIVVFSKKYASSTWCLNELVEIHKCYEELGQMVIPIFYDVDPSHVRKQIGDFGKDFNESCKGKPEDLRQRWIRALVEVANMAGEDSQNWSTEASMIERIANDVSKKLITPSNDFGDFVGIEAHIERLGSVLSLESEGVRRVGILGPSGIGKTTIARALFSRISSRFDHHAFVSYKRTNQDDFGMKLCWEETFLSEILCEKDIKICHLGVVEQKLKNKKVLIIVDDVDDLELLTTLVGQTRWVGSGSRIIVITQDRKLLKSHDIGLIYEVDFPLENLALQMFCRSAFGQNSPPDGFMELAVEVVWLSGNLPLGLNVFGSSFRGMDKEEWMEILPGLRDGLDGKIEKTLRRSYDRLDGKDQDLFLYIACLFSGRNVDYIKSMLGDRVNIRLRMLEYKSLIRITPSMNTVQMHSLLQKLGKEIVRAESINNPGQRRFLVDADDICDVFTNNSGTENVQGILFNTSEINEPLFMDENSFKGMRNLLFLKIYKERSKETGEGGLHLPQDLVHFPRKIRSLHWNEYPLKSMPFNFRAENLVKLKMRDSKLENLWEGTQVLPSLKKMDLRWSADLKEIPDLSTATNLEKLDIRECSSLVTLPSSIGNLKKMRVLLLKGCSELKVLPADISLKSLGSLDLRGCFKLKTFPRISRNISELFLSETEIAGEDCLWIENISQLNKLDWDGVPLKRMPSNFRPEYLMELRIRGSRLEKLWPGVQLLEDLKNMDLSGCESLKQIPDLSLATGLEYLELNNCRSLVMLPSSIRNLRSLTHLSMKGCTMLEVLPTGLTLESLRKLDLSGCSQLKCFPHISARITDLYLVDTAIEEVPSWIGYMVGLTNLRMSRCKKLKKISANILKLRLLKADFSDCEGMAIMFDASVMYDQLPGPHESPLPLTAIPQVSNLKLNNCFNLDRDAREIIARSYVYSAILPGGEVPMCFTHRAHGSSLIIPLHKSSFSPEDFGIKACIVVGPPTHPGEHSANIWVRWCFRGKKGVHLLDSDRTLYMMDHLVMFFFGMCNGKVDESPSDLNDVLQFEFYHHSHVCSCNNFGVNSHTQTCALLPQRIKACGVRVFNVSPPQSSLVQDLQWHGNLKQMDLSGDENLRRIPSLSIATDLEDLELNNCQSLVILPSSIRNLRKLTHLSMKGCTMLEVLPTGLYLESLRKLDLSGCSRLKCFPHISARIEDLYLIDTAIEEVPSWIENMVRLMNLKMSQCKKLKRISANIFKLRHLEADFSDCEGMTTMFDASVMDDQLPGCLPFTINNLKLNNCFNLDRDAQEIIAQAYIYSAVLPGAQVPMYFTHRASGSSLNIPLQMSSLFQEGINIKACIVVEPPIHPDDYSADIGVCWYLRGQKGFKTFLSEVDSCKMDHKVMKYFTLRWYEGDNESSTDLNDNILQFEFYYRSCGCYLDSYGFYEHTQSCALLPQRIKECGVRVVNFSPSQSPVTSVGRSETDDIYQLYGESDRCKKRMRSSRIITTWDMASFVNLKEFPDVSSFINLHCLSLNNCGNLVMVPSSIRYLNNLKQLYIVECTRLEVLPTNINLPSLLILDLSGCSRLKCFPQISMIISDLYLDDTAIEEVPSWIENMASLVNLKMRQCNKLKTISANILKLRLLKADFSDCEGLMTMSDASVMDDLLPRPHEDSFPLTITTRVSNLGLLPLGFYRRVGSNAPPTPLKLNNCFNLDRDSREIIAQSYVYSAILPGGEVPMYFTHQARGTSLNIPLHRSLISQEEFGFKACIVVGPPIHPEDCSADIWVRWCFRGKKGELLFGSEVASCKMDHLVMVFFGMPKEEVDESPSDLNYNVLQFEFYYHSHTGSCDNFGRNHYRQICPNLTQRIKGCGVRVLNILPSQDDTARSSVTEYNQQSGESDDQTNRICEAVYNHPARESDVETGRNKKRMRMTDITSQEPSTSLNSGLMAPNLELSLELVGASAPVYSRSMGDGPSLNLNLSPFDLCLGGESSCFDPMITEQEEDTGKPNEDPSLSPFDLCLGGESSYFDPMITEQEDTGTPNEDPSLSPQLVNYLR